MGKEERRKLVLSWKNNDSFEICWFALCFGRVLQMKDTGKQSREERQRDYRILQAFESISSPKIDEKIQQTGDELRILSSDGLECQLEKKDINRIIELIDRVTWSTHKLAVVETTIAWLSEITE